MGFNICKAYIIQSRGCLTVGGVKCIFSYEPSLECHILASRRAQEHLPHLGQYIGTCCKPPTCMQTLKKITAKARGSTCIAQGFIWFSSNKNRNERGHQVTTMATLHWHTNKPGQTARGQNTARDMRAALTQQTMAQVRKNRSKMQVPMLYTEKPPRSLCDLLENVDITLVLRMYTG